MNHTGWPSPYIPRLVAHPPSAKTQLPAASRAQASVQDSAACPGSAGARGEPMVAQSGTPQLGNLGNLGNRVLTKVT